MGKSGIARTDLARIKSNERDKVSALHIFECVHFLGRTHTVDHGCDGETAIAALHA